MTGLSTYTKQNVQNYISGRTAMPSLPTAYLGLLTTMGTDNGTGAVEVSASTYARVACSGSGIWGASTGVGPSTATNSGVITFGATGTVSWGTIVGVALFDALTGGNYLEGDFLGNDPWFPFTCTLASPGVINAPGITAGSSPALVNGAAVVFNAQYGGSLPAGIPALTPEIVAGLSSDTFNVGINTTSIGSGLVRQITQQSIPANSQWSFAAGALIRQL